MDDFTLNDMIDFFSASGSGVNVVVMDDIVVLEKEKKEMKENKDMDYEKWYWRLREHIGEDTWVDIWESYQEADEEEEIYCFCGYERDDKSKEGLDDWDTHIKECPTYHYKIGEKKNELI